MMWYFWSIVFVVFFSSCLHAQHYAVIANDTVSEIPTSQTKAIYLKKLKHYDTTPLVPVNFPPTNPIRTSFEKNILQMSSEELGAYWKQQPYLGVRPPITLASTQSVEHFVDKVEGAVGYTDNTQINATNTTVVQRWSEEEEELYTYTLGKGFQVGDLPIYVGGYFSLNYKHHNELNEYKLDDIALLSYGYFEQFSYMLELEFKDFYTVGDNDGNITTTLHDKLYFERAFVDYTFNDNYMIRVGRFNNLIGFWNMIPINVLRETTSSPVSTEIVFPRFSTGIYGAYTSFLNGELKIDVVAQNNKAISDDYNNYHVDEHYALGISYEQDRWTWKLNGGMFKKDQSTGDGDDGCYYMYMLASGRYEDETVQIMAELGSQRESGAYTTKYAGYLQGVYRFTPEHIGVVRLEGYESSSLDYGQNEKMIVGYTYRPLYPIAIKGEYQINSKSDLNQFLFSFSVLF